MPEAVRDHRQRLGRVMPFQSADGVLHQAAFWCLNFAAFAIGDSGARLEFLAFHSVDAYNAGAAPIAGAMKDYVITPDQWMASVFVPLPAPDQPFAVNFLLATWGVALSRKDVGDPPAEGEEDTRTSFFAESVEA